MLYSLGKKSTPMEYHPEIFEPYDRLIEVTICGEKKLVPENNSILRCLQYLDMERISNAAPVDASSSSISAMSSWCISGRTLRLPYHFRSHVRI